jgi:hypothetical protein
MTLLQLQQVLAILFPNAAPGSWQVTTDTFGNASIALWNNSIGAQPTAAQLTAALASVQLQQTQAAQVATLNASYQTARYGTPVTLISGTATLSFPTDVATQTNVTGYLVAFTATTAPATMPLQDVNGVTQQVTYAQLQTLAASIATQSITAYTTLEGLLAQVGAATTAAAVQAIVWPVA